MVTATKGVDGADDKDGGWDCDGRALGDREKEGGDEGDGSRKGGKVVGLNVAYVPTGKTPSSLTTKSKVSLWSGKKSVPNTLPSSGLPRNMIAAGKPSIPSPKVS